MVGEEPCWDTDDQQPHHSGELYKDSGAVSNLRNGKAKTHYEVFRVFSRSEGADCSFQKRQDAGEGLWTEGVLDILMDVWWATMQVIGRLAGWP